MEMERGNWGWGDAAGFQDLWVFPGVIYYDYLFDDDDDDLETISDWTMS